MNGSEQKQAASAAGQSLFAAIVYSIFEGIRLRHEFPLYNPHLAVEGVLWNIGVFLAAGLATALGLRLTRRPASASVIPGLIAFPVYFFLLAEMEESPLVLHFLGDARGVALLLVPAVAALYLLVSRWVARSPRRGPALLVAAFFFIEVGHPRADWGPIFKGRPDDLPSVGIVLAVTAALYLVMSRLGPLLRERCAPLHRHAGPWGLLAGITAAGLALLHTGVLPGPGPEDAPPDAGRPNVLLIVLDTARADRFSCYGNPRHTTPFLEAFGQDATLYPHVVAPAPWTVPGHASIFTGLYPSAHGMWENYHLDARFETLAEFLASKGYRTVGICNNGFVSRENGLARGFDTYVEMWRERVLNPTLRHRLEWFGRRALRRHDGGAMRTNQWAVEWLTRMRPPDRPFFLYINVMEAHLGSDAPDAWHRRYLRKDPAPGPLGIFMNKFQFLTGLEEMSEAEWADFRDIYDGDLRYLDSRLEELVDFLRARSLLDDTIVIITSDHGEHLGEHRFIGHFLSLYEPVLRVPLLIRVPESLGPLPRRDGFVQTLDIYPTLVDLLGFAGEGPRQQMQGISLLRDGERPSGAAIAEFEPVRSKITSFLEEHPEETEILKYDRGLKAIRTDSLKYIWSSNGDSELYDLALDPEENRDIRPDHGEAAAALEARLNRWLASFEHAGKSREVEDLDSETRQRLRALGYID
jgi:arylsulfatase A-like enzyme